MFGIIQPTPRPSLQVQEHQTACPWPRAALRAPRRRWAVCHVPSPPQTHAAEPHVPLSHRKSSGFPDTPSLVGGRGCGVLKRKTHSKILHKTPHAMPSRCVFKCGTKQQKVWNRRQLKTSLWLVHEQCITSCKTDGMTGDGSPDTTAGWASTLQPQRKPVYGTFFMKPIRTVCC